MAVQCPRCSGTQFREKRSAGGKMTAGLLAPKSRLKCVTCGAEYRRGQLVNAPANQPQNVPPPADPPGWYPDPLGRHEYRWFGGVTWMSAVMDNGHQTDDPLP